MEDDLEYAVPESLSILLAGTRLARRHRGLEPDRLIRCLRRGAGLSQREIAARAKMRQARVSEIERGGLPARWNEVRKLLEAMGCEPVLLAVSSGYRPKPAQEDWDA